MYMGLSWSWSYGSWIYNYLCNQCLSPLQLWVQTLFMERYTRYNIIRGKTEKSQIPAGKISISLVGDQKSFPRVSEIFPSCPLTGVWFYFSLNIFVLFTLHRAFSCKIVFRWWSFSIYRYTFVYWQYFNCIS